MKRFFGILLTVVMMLSTFVMVVPPIEAEAATTLTEIEFASRIAELKSRYPHNQFWNEYNGTETIAGRKVAKAGTIGCNGTSTAEGTYGKKCTDIKYCNYCTCECGYFYGWQCFGFANLLAYHTFGSYATTGYSADDVNNSKGWTYLKSVSTFYAGDVVRINNNHSLFVYKVTDTEVFYAECNNGYVSLPCQINWNGKTTISKLKSSVTFVVRMEGNTLKGTGGGSLTVKYHANGGTIAEPVVVGTNYRVYTTDGSYAIARSGPGVSYGEVTRFSSGTVLTVIETQKGGSYTWGKVKYNDKDIWVALGDWMISAGTAYDSSYYLSSSIVYSLDDSQPVATKGYYGQQLQDGLYNNTTFKLYKDGHEFIGWSLTPDGNSVIIYQGQDIKPEEIVPEIANSDQIVTVYAIWKKIACNHTYSNACDTSCNECGAIRDVIHVYSSDNDAICNECGYEREIACDHNWITVLTSEEYHILMCVECTISRQEEHTYYNDIWGIMCSECGYKLTCNHWYSNSCDDSCNSCGEIRAISHTYTNDCDAICNVCEAKREASHIYSNGCDDKCNVCDTVRPIYHIYSNDSDITCNVCGATRDITHTHSYGDYEYDFYGHWRVCFTCGESEAGREDHVITSVYIVNEIYHGGNCSICGGGIALKHTYTDECDKYCNDCNIQRQPDHVYTNADDEYCDICGEPREEICIIHNFSSWIINTDPTCTIFGVQSRYCENCNYIETIGMSKLDHSDINNDGECDMCGESYGDNINSGNNTDDNQGTDKDNYNGIDSNSGTGCGSVIGGSLWFVAIVLAFVVAVATDKKRKY